MSSKARLPTIDVRECSDGSSQDYSKNHSGSLAQHFLKMAGFEWLYHSCPRFEAFDTIFKRVDGALCLPHGHCGLASPTTLRSRCQYIQLHGESSRAFPCSKDGLTNTYVKNHINIGVSH